MKAIVCETFDHPKQLMVQEVAAPNLGENDVLIDIAATGLGYVDALMVSGLYQIKPNLPFIPGSEIAGTVVGTGSAVKSLKPGDRVLAMPSRGGLAEQVAVPEAACFEIPQQLSFEAAAAFLVNYCTAYHGLIHCGALAESETVLILGASGGVGVAAIDLAKSLGSRVIAAVSSQEKLGAALRAGADTGILYSEPSWRDDLKAALNGAPLDVVYDPVGGDYADPALRSLAPGGRYLVVGFASGAIPQFAANLALLKQISIIGVNWGAHVAINPQISQKVTQDLLTRISDHRLRPEAGQCFTLSQTGAAMTQMLDRKAIGKVVITQE